MEITKVSGEKESFEKEKFCDSLRAVKAPDDLVLMTCQLVERELSPGISTEEIFRKASSYLMKESPPVAMRYNLKRAMLSLGPAGFHFEHYVEILLRADGYETRRNVMMEGKCVSHEVDVVADKGIDHYLIEAKYRNDQKLKTNIEVIMYADARLLDIRPMREKQEGDRKNIHRMWLITNAKFTSKTIQYGTCREIKMTGWNYPRGGESLEAMIGRTLRYPITILPSINHFSLEQFAKEGMMLAQDLLPYTPLDLEKRFSIDEKYARIIIEEAHALIGHTHQDV